VVVPCAALRRRDKVDPFGRSRKAGRPFDKKKDSRGCATVQIPARDHSACLLIALGSVGDGVAIFQSSMGMVSYRFRDTFARIWVSTAHVASQRHSGPWLSRSCCREWTFVASGKEGQKHLYCPGKTKGAHRGLPSYDSILIAQNGRLPVGECITVDGA